MNILKRVTLACLVGFFLAACLGGGGGGGNGGNAGTGGGGGGAGSGGSGSVVTAANAPAVAGDVVATTEIVQDLGGGSSASFVGVAVQTSDGKFSLSDYARWQILKLGDLQSQANANGIVGVQVGPETVPCDSGSITLSGNFADPSGDEITSGDSASLTFNNCIFSDFGDTFNLNGTVAITFTTVTGDLLSFPFNLVAQFTLTNFQVTDGAETFSGNGSFSFSLSTSNGVTFTGSITGSSISVSGPGLNSTLTSFSINFTSNDATGEYTVDASGTVSSSALGGTFTFTTTTPFRGIGENDPFEGVAVITADDNSSVTLIVLDFINVRLEVDEDGDGVADQTTDTTWNALL